MVKDIDLNIRNKEKEIEEERKKCAHKWDEGYETGETVKHLIGQSEKKEYTCEICGVNGYNV